jgi:hypothetical protein
MIASDPKRYEALFEQFKRLHPEYSDEVPYFPTDNVLRAFQAWADRALHAAINGGDAPPLREGAETKAQMRLRTGANNGPRDDGVAETLWTLFQAENPGFLDRVAGDLRTAHERERALAWARLKAEEEEEADELLPVTRRLLRGGVDE